MQYLRLDALEPYKLKECKFKFSHPVTAGAAWRELVSCCQASRSLLPVLGGATRCSSVTVELYVDLIMCMLEKARHKCSSCNYEIWADTSEVGYFKFSSSFQSASVMPGLILDLILMPFCSMRISFPKPSYPGAGVEAGCYYLTMQYISRFAPNRKHR